MPQMAPMSWLILFIIFSMFFYFNMVKIYFMNSQESAQASKFIKNKMFFNWKW